MSEKVIGIFQIGPVQEFISKSRKTQDFWASSFLLSYLISIGIKTIQEKGGNLIYPYSDKNLLKILQEECTPILPNRFVVELDNENAEEILKNAEEKIKEEFLSISNLIKNSLIKNTLSLSSNSYINKIFDRQTQDFFEIYWITYPIDGNYPKVYKKAEIIFNGRKSIRNFAQIDEPGFKCTLCGERESLSDKTGAKRGDVKKYWDNMRKLYNYEFKDDEHLCAICTTKRIYPKSISKFIKVCEEFNIGAPSTPSIAISPFLERLIKKSNEVKEEIKNFNNKAKNLNNIIKETIGGKTLKKLQDKVKSNNDLLELIKFDGTYFIKDTYENLLIEHPSKKGEIEEVLEILKRFYKVAGNPSKYFAVIQVDGDNIGKEIGTKNSVDEHRDFSKKIIDFALSALDVENEYLAKVIYFGGDEGVIFVCLRDLLDVISYIHDLFKNKVAQNGKPTNSFGVVIAHYTHPLKKVIEESRKALKEAKNIDPDKHAIGFSLLKRSGETISFVIKYKPLLYSKTTIEFMKNIKELYEKEIISKRWWKDLYNDRFSFIERNKRGELILNKDIFILEVMRYFLRRIDKSKLGSSSPKSISDEIKEFIEALPVKNGFDIFMGMMEIIEFIAREE